MRRSPMRCAVDPPEKGLPPLVIDLHLHLLHGVDDGATDLAASLAMIVRAAELGFDRLVATPHLDGPLSERYRSLVAERLAELVPRAAELGVDVVTGFEHKLSPDLASRLEAGEGSTLGGSTAVLVELPFQGWPLSTDQALFDLMSAGYRPVLAHPERYQAVQDNPDLALDLAERGVLHQLTFGSITGLFGKPAMRVSELLLERDAVAVLASDAHSAGQRYVAVSQGRQRAEELIGRDRVRQLTVDNPAALLSDSPLPESVFEGAEARRPGVLTWARRMLVKG